MKYPIPDIKIGQRQRLDMGDITELADSLKRLGQIHSIGVDDTGLLIWGMRRLLAAKELGWTEIEATVRTGLTVADAQEIELEEDIRRKDRTWQEECIALSKLVSIKARQARAEGKTFGVREMATYSGFGKSFVAQYVFTVGNALQNEPRDEVLWECPNYSAALEHVRQQQEKAVYAEMQKRRTEVANIPIPKETIDKAIAELDLNEVAAKGYVHTVDTTLPKKPLTLRERSLAYNSAFSHLWNQQLVCSVNPKNPTEQFLHGYWFVGGGNISSFYGSYQIEYLKRINTLFPDIKGKTNIVHLFSGSIPISDSYTVVGLPDHDGNTPDIVCDAEKLSSGLLFQPQLIFADPPYSIEDSEHYANAMVNRERVMSECAVVLQPGGFLVWIDQALPLFSNNELNLVGAISYIRSTGNRFRVVSIFRKPLPVANICPPTPSLAEINDIPLENQEG